MSAQEDWLNSAIGKGFNPDNHYGYQCKDVADSYCLALFGNWINTIRPGNAKDCFAGSSPDYFQKMANNANDLNQVPPRGAIIVWNANMGGGFGHIAVVLAAGPNGFDVVEQNGLLVKYDANGAVIDIGRPAYKQHYTSYRNVIGWLIPKVTGGNVVAETIEQLQERLLHGPGGIDDWTRKHYQVTAELNATRDQLNNAKAQVSSQQGTIEQMGQQISQLQAELAEAKKAPVFTTTPVSDNPGDKTNPVPPIEPTPVKPGYQTSEFWATGITTVLGYLIVFNDIPLPAGSPEWIEGAVKTVAAAATFLSAVVYAHDRKNLKSEAIRTTGQVIDEGSNVTPK
jgi:hypothetical protein